MELHNHTPAVALEVDPAGGEVEPNLGVISPGFDPKTSRDGLFSDAGGNRLQMLAAIQSEYERLVRLSRDTVDGMVAIENRLRTLEQRRFYVYGAWTTLDSLVSIPIPWDRMPGSNWILYRIIALCTADSAVANEALTVGGLLTVPFQVTAQRDWTVTGNAIPIYDLPIKSASFTLAKAAGGAFTSKGILIADFREASLV